MTARRLATCPARTGLQAARTAWAYCLIACLTLCIPGQSQADAVEHIVILWLQDPGNAAHRARIISESQVLREIPGVTQLRTGGMLPSQRAIVDSSFDVALIVSLRDAAAMVDYLAHPIHVKLVGETLKPLVKKIQVYDFTLTTD
jgi:hypothetical protein